MVWLRIGGIVLCVAAWFPRVRCDTAARSVAFVRAATFPVRTDEEDRAVWTAALQEFAWQEFVKRVSLKIVGGHPISRMLTPPCPRRDETRRASPCVDVTILMPCLNEAASLPHCLVNAYAALAEIELRLGLRGEILVADNGSRDDSVAIALRGGARVVPIAAKGYGAALIGGCDAAFGRFILMGDADGSYDFRDGVAMIERLDAGADLCMGSRFDGAIAPGAMPWKNRYIGNPLLTGVLNLFFRTGINDAHCGLRAITRAAYDDLRLSGQGMEFASEMLIKASLKRLTIAQVPATLKPDLRMRPPHLRPWRDGWRHLRYLLMLSPTWVFGVPAAAAIGAATLILGVALLHLVGMLPGVSRFGTSWTIVAGFLLTGGHFAAIMALATHFYGVRQGYRLLRPVLRRHAGWLTLETLLITGVALILVSFAAMLTITYHWSQIGYSALPSILPLVIAAVIGTIGLQTIFGGFLLAIIAGHVADFARDASQSSTPRRALAADGNAVAPEVSAA